MNIKVRQRDITDCGAACLASVAAHFRVRIPVSRIRLYAGTDKKGTNVLGLTEAAKKLGFLTVWSKEHIHSDLHLRYVDHEITDIRQLLDILQKYS